MKTRLLALGLAGCLLAGCLCACSDTGDAAGESSLPDRKDGGSRTLTAVNNNGDIQVAFVGQPESAV